MMQLGFGVKYTPVRRKLGAWSECAYFSASAFVGLQRSMSRKQFGLRAKGRDACPQQAPMYRKMYVDTWAHEQMGRPRCFYLLLQNTRAL